MTDKIERRSGFTYITALPKEAGFPMSMDYDEEDRILYVTCANGKYKIDLSEGSKIYRIAVLSQPSGEEAGDRAQDDGEG